MGDLFVWLVVGSLIAAVAVALWKVLLVVAPIALGVWVIAKIAIYGMTTVEKRRAERSAVVARAEKQHRSLMSGDETTGTFGDYLPVELEKPVPVMPTGESTENIGTIVTPASQEPRVEKPARVGKPVIDTGRLRAGMNLTYEMIQHWTTSQDSSRRFVAGMTLVGRTNGGT